MDRMLIAAQARIQRRIDDPPRDMRTEPVPFSD
jgi:hypothetical protein